AGQRGLAAARLADNGEDLGRVGLQPQADAADGGDVTARQQAAGVAPRYAVDLEQGGAHGAPTWSAWKQAARWPAATSVIGGASRRQMSVAKGQRGWKRHPAGGSVRLGGVPPRPSLGVLAMIHEVQRELGSSIIFVTHDMAVHANLADRLGIMYAGRRGWHAP